MNNNFTTIEQSKRLLVLGLPVDSADCYYNLLDKGRDKTPIWRNEEELQDKNLFKYSFIKPCWSVGQLVKIFLKCSPYREIALNKSELAEQLVISFFMTHKKGLFDFSKLENL